MCEGQTRRPCQYSANCVNVTGAGGAAGAVGDPGAHAGSSPFTTMGSVPAMRCISSGVKNEGSSHTSRVTARNAVASIAPAPPPPPTAAASNSLAASPSFAALCSSVYACEQGHSFRFTHTHAHMFTRVCVHSFIRTLLSESRLVTPLRVNR